MKIAHQNLVWQNFANPDFNDLAFLKDELKVSNQVLAELVSSNKRPKIEEYEKYMFLVIHFPVFNERTRPTTPTELDFIITPNSILTVYQSPIPVFEDFFNGMQNTEIRRQECFKSSGWLLFCILDKLFDSCLPMLDHIHEKIEEIEEQVFQGKEREMLKEIAIVKRDIIDFRRTVKPQRSVLELLTKKSARFLKEHLDIIAQEVIGSEIRVWNILENHKEMIEAIETTNAGLLSYQINRVMHTLTFFSIIIFSLTFIATFFGMKIFENHPLTQNSQGIWIIGGIMLTAILVITLFFKKKKLM